MEIIVGKKAIAGAIQITIETLNKWEKIIPLPRIGPPGSQVRVLKAELFSWLKSFTVSPISQEPPKTSIKTPQ